MGNIINLPNISPEAVENLKFDTSAVQKKSGYDEKNYLNVRLGENESSRELRIRLLPMDLETGNAFVHAYFHSIRVPKEVSASEWKSFLCLKRNTEIDHQKFGDKCPFCELNQKAYEASLNETDEIKKKNYQQLSLDNHVKDAIIVRCIERGKEEEGVKFWKFNLSKRKDDPYNIMMDLYNSAKREGEMMGEAVNIFDLYNGKDIVINLKKNIDNKNDIRTVISLSLAGYKSPLSTSEEQMKKWIYDEKKWTDVFTPKPFEYLSLISQGIVPWYDKQLGKWVSKEEYNSRKEKEKVEADKAIAIAEQAAIGQVPYQQPQVVQPQAPASNGNYGDFQGYSGYGQPYPGQYQGTVPNGMNISYSQPVQGNDIMSQLNADNEDLPI